MCITKKPNGKGSVPPGEKVEVSQLWPGQNLDGKGLFSVRRRMKSQCVVELGWDWSKIHSELGFELMV